jgi:hypothetical protein
MISLSLSLSQTSTNSIIRPCQPFYESLTQKLFPNLRNITPPGTAKDGANFKVANILENRLEKDIHDYAHYQKPYKPRKKSFLHTPAPPLRTMCNSTCIYWFHDSTVPVVSVIKLNRTGTEPHESKRKNGYRHQNTSKENLK